MIMTHSDDKGLVFPPRVSEIQVAIVVIPPTKGDRDQVWQNILALANKLVTALEARDVRVVLDDRTDKTPGFKYNHWELQGVPLRIEIGAKDLEINQVMTVRRDNNAKSPISASVASIEASAIEVENLLETMQKDMLERARGVLQENIQIVRTWDEVVPALKARKLVLAPWCEDKETEDEIKKKTRLEFEEDEKNTGMSGAMKTLCLPLERSGYQLPIQDEKCFFTGKPAKRWTLWGRSY
jgi:prolyl-tRNA synthetase